MKFFQSIKLSTFSIFFALIFVSCSATPVQEKSADADNSQTVSSEDPKVQAKKILDAYLEIKNALVQTDGEVASNGAEKLLTILGENKDELIEKIRFDAEHIAETKDAGHQRDHFNTLSDNVYALVKKTSANETTVYRQFCPMAMNSKGAYWLSAEKEVNNPYFGDKMLHCGMVKEELN
ncbi:MAG: DUF3347 domain-containing protein [Bacteroidia bacterium]